VLDDHVVVAGEAGSGGALLLAAPNQEGQVVVAVRHLGERTAALHLDLVGQPQVDHRGHAQFRGQPAHRVLGEELQGIAAEQASTPETSTVGGRQTSYLSEVQSAVQ
jgi:hypothetical protein